MTLKTYFIPGVFSGLWTYQPVLDAYQARMVDLNNPNLYLDPAEVTIRDLAEHTLAMIETESPADDIRIFGHSMGGYVIFELMRLMRERSFDMTRIKGLAFLGTSAESDSDEKKTQRMGQVTDIRGGNYAKVVDTMIRAIFGDRFAKANPDFIENTVRRDLMDPAKAYDVIFSGQQYAIVSRPHYRNEGDLALLPDCPVIFIWGNQDKVIPEPVREATKAAASKAQYVILPDTGHMLTVENPDGVLAALKTIF